VGGDVEGSSIPPTLTLPHKGRGNKALAGGGNKALDRVPADVCDYSLARNLVLLAVAVASETLLRFVLEGTPRNWSATLRDFAVRSLELPTP
jgi:hypothetical protein